MNQREKIQRIVSHLVDKRTAPRRMKVYFLFAREIGGVVSIKLGDIAELDVLDSKEAAEMWQEVASAFFKDMHIQVESMTLGDYIEKYEDDEEEED